MKRKLLAFGLTLVLGATALTGCGASGGADDENSGGELQKIVVGATAVPHAEILKVIVDDMKAIGYDLEVKEFAEYAQLNPALNDGQIDANYFQHLPFLEDFNSKNNTDLASAGFIHYEPFGLYPSKVKAIADLKDGSKIAIPNDGSNEARALLLLEAQGLIKLNPNAGIQATKTDITDNPKNLDIIELDAAQIPRALPDVDMAVINGNYALQAGLNAGKDAIVVEDKDSPFANLIAVKAGDEEREDIKALVSTLQSEKVRQFIEEKYEGAVVPVF